MSGLASTATAATALGCALVGGAFFAFSSFVMDALDRLPDDQGIAAMQEINKTAVRPLFMLAMFGTALACVALGVHAVVAWGDRGSAYLVAGAALYLVGTIALTIAANVPLNDSLATLDPHGEGAAADWKSYLSDWTRWNHVRSAAALGAAGLFTAAL
jgi:uncharacterized membrane protein